MLPFIIATLTLACLATAPGAFGQTGLATVSGRITDQQAAVVAGAEVEIKNTDTNESVTRPTDQDGLYTIPSLRPGRYVMLARKAGFKTVSVKQFTLNVGDDVRRNISLEVGDVSESITVTADAENLNTTNAMVSTVIEREMVENMPLNGRSFQSLLELTPGINPAAPGPTNGGVNQQGQFTVNGQRGDANYFTVDGVSANAGSSIGTTLGQAGAGSLPGTTALGGYNGLVSIDALQEFRVSTSSFSPEYGRTPGGQVALITRSGTNSFHGDVFDYLRNTALDANDWFLNRAGLKGTERQNDFGGVLGGPMVKNKLFFFGSYEGLRLTNPQAGSTDTFTQSAQALAASVVGPSTPSYTGYMAQILKAYPLPTTDKNGNITLGTGTVAPATTPCTSNPLTCVALYTGAFPSTSHLDSGSLRIDYSLNNKVTLFGRYVDSPSSTLSQGSSVAINNSGISLGSRSATAGVTNIISSTVSNDLRFNYSRSSLLQSQLAPGFTGSVGTLFPDGFARPAGYSPSEMQFAFQFLGLVPALNIAQAPTTRSRQEQFNVVDGLLVAKGAHTFKTGADFRLLYPNVNVLPYSLTGIFYQPPIGGQTCNSPSGCTGGGTPPGGGTTPPVGGGGTSCGPSQNPPPLFLCGAASTVIVQANSEQDFRMPIWSLYLQDSWRMAKGLTLTYGARYEVAPAPHSLNGKPFFSLKDFDPVLCTTAPSAGASSQCNVGANPLGTAPYATTWGNIAPRIGVAWQISQNPRWGTVLRAGFGRFYDAGGDAAAGLASPFAPIGFAHGIQFPVSADNASYVTPPPVQTNISPSSPYTAPASGPAPGLQLPRTYQFNVALQQALGRQQSFTLSYVGALGRGLISAITLFPATVSNVNVPPSPTFQNNLIVYGNYATSDYHALQAQFQRHFYKGLGATASYTWSHSLDDASDFNAGNEGGAGNFPASLNRSSSDFDIRQTFTASMVYDPAPPFKSSSIASALLGHWSIDPIFHFQTALPVNVLAGTNYNGNVLVIERANLIPGVPIYVGGAECAAEHGGNPCPGGRGINNAAVGAPLGATSAQASAARCQPGTAVGAFCSGLGINPGGSVDVQGTLGRNALRGFPLQQLDLAIHREFPVGDRFRLRFEGDIFNVFNHPNFSSPQSNISLPNFGVATSMLNSSFGTGNAAAGGGYNSLYSLGGPRSVQLALKIIF